MREKRSPGWRAIISMGCSLKRGAALQRVCSNNNKFDVLTGDRMIQGCRVYGPSVEIL